jgi:hypothetical protein
MEPIRRGSVSLLYFTIKRDEFTNLYPPPPYRYFLVTQVFSSGGEYICTQLLGIDLRAVKYLATQGCEHRTAASVNPADRERIQSCMDQYARALTDRVAEAVFGHIVGPASKIQ